MTRSFLCTRRIALSVAAGLALSLAAISLAQAAAKIQHLISPGGIQAWFVQDAVVPLIAVEYSFAGGAAQDPADKPGVASLVAALLDEGSGDLDSKTFHERLERRAIELSFSAGRDTFRGSPRMLRDNKDEAFDLLRMALTSPHFHPADVERIRLQVTAGLRHDTTNPSALANRKFLEIAFGDHPCGHQASGTLDSVPTITVADMNDYVGRVLAEDRGRRRCRRGNARQIARPDVRQLAGKGDADAGGRCGGGQAADAHVLPQTVIAFGGPSVKRSDPNFMAAYVVNHILGGSGPSSRLYREVREKRGLAYSMFESLLWMEHSAVFIGNTGTRADRAGDTIDAVEKEVCRIAEEGPTQKELEEAKSYLKGSQMLALDASSKLAQGLLQYQEDKLPIDYIERRNAIIEAVTLDDAKQATRRLWGQGLLTVVVGRAPQAAAQPAAAPAPRSN